MPAKQGREVRGAAQVVELHLGFGVEVGGQQELAAHHVGGQKRVGLGQDHEVDTFRVEQCLEPVHQADPVLRGESAAAPRFDADVDVRLGMRRSHRVAGCSRCDLLRATAEHIDREQLVLSGECFEPTLKIRVHAAIMARETVEVRPQEVDVEVVVHEHVAHADHLLPCNLRHALPGSRGQPARGLADVLDELLESQQLDRVKVAITGVTR